MLIGIDGNEANVEKRVGVHQYAYHILWGLYNLRKKKENNHKFIIYLKDNPRKDLPKPAKYWEYKIIPGKSLWIVRHLMPALLKNKELDVFFTPSHYLPFLTPGLAKVCTIHDLGYLIFSEQFKKYDYWQLKLWTAISISISKYIIAVSEFTKKDIVRHYSSSSKKIEVVHHGYDKDRYNIEISNNVVRRVVKKYGIRENENYILFLSTLKPSKNVEGLLEAYASISNEIKLPKLVIAGKKGWMYESIYEKVKELGLKKHVVFTDYVSEEDKPALIAGAKAFVLPSFWEGFGMDVLNALGCGTPVIVSSVASLPEVAGKAGIYVDPNSSESIAKGIKKVLSMSVKEYNKLVDAGFDQAQKFFWEHAAKETMLVLEKAGGKNGFN